MNSNTALTSEILRNLNFLGYGEKGMVLKYVKSMVEKKEAKKAKEEGREKTILVNFSGHGLLDLSVYSKFLEGQLEDYALLIGSIALFIILAVVMYISRRIDWYAVADPEDEEIQRA